MKSGSDTHVGRKKGHADSNLIYGSGVENFLTIYG